MCPYPGLFAKRRVRGANQYRKMVRYARGRDISNARPRENGFAQRTISRDTVLHAPYVNYPGHPTPGARS